ncbi:unnamed protein product [Phytophthora fragariaefolia]|uniref:Unnamed protein product n=1 Tax=Phytophthora fragariaefolia TaxID=1490495 RepID=A0A9W6XIP0_9STRA|nr:unnamed protein product [Phytophthora fragariaefolia]
MPTRSDLTCNPSKTVLILSTGRQSLPRIGIITLPVAMSILGCHTLRTPNQQELVSSQFHHRQPDRQHSLPCKASHTRSCIMRPMPKPETNYTHISAPKTCLLVKIAEISPKLRYLPWNGYVFGISTKKVKSPLANGPDTSAMEIVKISCSILSAPSGKSTRVLAWLQVNLALDSCNSSNNSNIRAG